MAKLLPQNIGKYKHIQDLDQVFADRLAALPIESLIIYLVDTVEASALPFLAEQFGVNGFAGWQQAQTVEQKREIVKNAINLQRKKGTVYAIKEAIRSVGLGNATLVEGAGLGPNGWAEFTVHIENSGQAVDLEANQKLTKLILEYKNERSHFLGIEYGAIVFDDSLTVNDEVSIYESFDLSDQLIIDNGKKLDGSWRLNGAVKLGNSNEQLEIS